MPEIGILDRFFTRRKTGETTGVGILPGKERQAGRPFLQEPWLAAYIEGNVLIPQKHYAINTLVLSAVLDNPPQNWSDFTNSVLSDEQLQKLGRIMTNVHRSKDITRAASDLVATGEQKVSDGKLQQLWTGRRGPREEVYKALKAYSKLDHGKTFGGSDGFAQLKVVADNLAQRLRSDEVRTYIERYKTVLVQSKKVVYRRNDRREYDEVRKPLNDNLRAIIANLRDAIGASSVNDNVKELAARLIADSFI